MGEVHKAHDARLNRDVAVKTCLLGVDATPEGRARFEREARAVAALSHRHICTVYDVGSHDGLDYLVMEYLEGETLAVRLTRGPLPLDEALRHARQMAEALAAAHAAGIVHRDLKPQNVMLTASGVKLFDFGLARRQPLAAETGAGVTATELTRAGSLVGTVPYMAPEQVEGGAVDQRADLFAFGAILFEMVTGRRAFPGDSAASVITAIMRDTPPAPSSLAPLLPGSLDRIVAACLAKDRDARWHCAHDLRQQLEWLEGGDGTSGAALPARPSRPWVWALGAAAIVAAVAAAWNVWPRRQPSTPGERSIALRIDPPDGTTLDVASGPPMPQLALSPDGQRIAFIATSREGRQRLYMRQLDSQAAEAVAGTEGAMFPFWAPDNRTVAFFTVTDLMTVDDSGERPRVVVKLGNPRGGTWITAHDLIVAGGPKGALFRVAASGGTLEELVAPDSPSRRFAWPTAIPGQPWLLVSTLDMKSPVSGASVSVRSLNGAFARELLQADAAPTFAPPDTLLILRSGIVFAQTFDPVSATLTGAPRRLIDGVAYVRPSGSVALAASARGDVAHVQAHQSGAGALTWWSRTGQRLGTLGPEGEYSGPALSRDNRFVSVRRTLSEGPLDTNKGGVGSDLFILNVDCGASTRFTFDEPPDSSPVWDPSGRALAFSSLRQGLDDLWVKPVGAGGVERLILAGPAIPTDWSSDGRAIIFQRALDGWQFGVGTVSPAAPHTVAMLVDTPFLEVQGRLSPDGRWLAYASNESGGFEVYVQPIPPDGRRYPVSIGGGSEPSWRGDGKELFYLTPDGMLMSVAVTLGDEFRTSPPEALFRLDVPPLSLPYRSRIAVSQDGQRILAIGGAPAPKASIQVQLNWRQREKTQ